MKQSIGMQTPRLDATLMNFGRSPGLHQRKLDQYCFEMFEQILEWPPGNFQMLPKARIGKTWSNTPLARYHKLVGICPATSCGEMPAGLP